MNHVLDFLATFTADKAPHNVRHQARRVLLDTVGVGYGGYETRLSKIIRDHSAEIYPGLLPMAFDGRGVNAPGYALALASTIDALDGHDGFNPAKGHIGAGLIPALLSLGAHHEVSSDDFEAALIAGYELGSRFAVALHATSPDYHTSGAWVAVAIAAAGAKMIGLDTAQTAHAMGIAEYHGPRSQMMRCIDHPTMLKDGSGWGALAGVSAVMLAQKGFTGGPAITAREDAGNWQSLGDDWLIMQQYFKPYPVCRWAQAPVEAVLKLREAHQLTPDLIQSIEILTFHEATRLATIDPKTTEQAQYSTAFPAAIALVHGRIGPEDMDESNLDDPVVQRVAATLTMTEDDFANETFPNERFARARISLTDGRIVESDWKSPRWDAKYPPSDDELVAKFTQMAEPRIGRATEGVISRLMAEAFLAPGDIVDMLARPLR